MPAIEGQSIAAVSPGSECPRPPVPIGPLGLFLLPEMAVMMTNVQKETKERCTQDQTPREIGNSPAPKQFPRPDSRLSSPTAVSRQPRRVEYEQVGALKDRLRGSYNPQRPIGRRRFVAQSLCAIWQSAGAPTLLRIVWEGNQKIRHGGRMRSSKKCYSTIGTIMLALVFSTTA